MKRRPIARDRELADILINIPYGKFILESRDTEAPREGGGFSLARLKREGSWVLSFGRKEVEIYPENK